MAIGRFVAGALGTAVALLSQVVDNQTVSKRFALTGGAEPEIVVAIVTGSIRVTTHAGSEAILTAKAHYEAPDAAALAELKQRLRLETEQSGANVWIGVQSENWGGSQRERELGWRNKPKAAHREERHTAFRHDIELQVPRRAHLKLRTVNGGAIAVDGVAGEFDLNNVNGGIEVRNADGHGRLHTVNGPITVAFSKNPGGNLSIKTINGKVNLGLPSGVDADFRIKTFNAKVYSDFAMLARADAGAASSEERGMKRIWRANGFSNARVGKGGPEISIDGFNGDIRILENK